MTFLLIPALAGAQEFPYEARVSVPVADLRKEPSEPKPGLEHDPLQESQLLQGDRVIVLEENTGWARVSVPDQQEWTHHQRWEGYPGWVRLSDLSRDDEPPELSTQGSGYKILGAPAQTREAVVQAAKEFLGIPYYWGGRSKQGVDCSGLTGLAYQFNGIRIPRDAHEQWMKARGVTKNELRPADLIFLSSPDNSKKITHVMLYLGDGRLIEGPGTGKKVREAALESRLKDAQTEGRKVYYGTYFSAHGSTSSP